MAIDQRYISGEALNERNEDNVWCRNPLLGMSMLKTGPSKLITSFSDKVSSHGDAKPAQNTRGTRYHSWFCIRGHSP
jgi:hypothetical protein